MLVVKMGDERRGLAPPRVEEVERCGGGAGGDEERGEEEPPQSRMLPLGFMSVAPSLTLRRWSIFMSRVRDSGVSSSMESTLGAMIWGLSVSAASER